VRHWLLPVALLALAGYHAAVGASAGPYVPSIVAITVNDQSFAPTLVVVRDSAGGLFLTESGLARLRLRTPASGAVVIDGQRYYRLDGASDVMIDEATQSIRLTLPPSAFLATRSAANSLAPPHVTPSRLGGFVNYDLYGLEAADQSSLGAIFETGLFGASGVLTNSALGQRAGSRGSVVRLESTWTLDLPEKLQTLRVGDSINATGAWGQAARFGGVHFGTNFATQPTLITTPLLLAQGEAILPSTVDVLVNGQRVASDAVPPGPFTIDKVPAINGAGEMQVIVTDALGRQQVLSQAYYTGPALLHAGLNEYSFDAGAIREDYASRSNAYGDFMMSGTFRRGITDRLTAELHAEGEWGSAGAVGIDGALQVGNLGIATLTAAVGGDGDLGWLGGVGFQRAGPRLSVFAQTRYTSEEFEQLGTGVRTDRPKQRSFGGFGFSLGEYGNLQLSYGRQSYWARPSTDVLGFSYSVTLGNFGYLGFLANRSTGDGSSTDVIMTWTMPLGDRRTASLAVERSPGTAGDHSTDVVAAVQQSLPAGTGAGYYVAMSSNENAQLDYYYQGAAGLIGAHYARRDGQDGWRVDASGGLALTSAGIMPATALDESFAVVELADYAGLTVYVDNQPVGRTDARGRVLLDSMRAYEASSVSIDPTELPLDASLATASMTVTPAYRSGPVVRFPVIRASAATLRLLQSDGVPVPAGATVATRSERTPVARDGLVYLTTAEGEHDATAEWPGHRCRFNFTRPDEAGPQPDLGDITCVESAAPASAAASLR
jgi:outer membrane usher protein